MFTVIRKSNGQAVTVYAVDFVHDAFLIYSNDEFRWVSMKRFEPVGDATCQE